MAPQTTARTMDEEVLINIVREYRELYDPEHRLYEDHNKREASWQEIAKRTQLPAFECRDRWKRLRDNYRKAKKLRQVKRSQGFTKIKKIKHEKIMSFIDNVIRRNRSDSDTAKEAAGSATVLLRERHIDTEDPLLQERMSAEEPPPKPDTLVTFFTNLGETVKTFPEEVQIRVKRDIFKIINEAEELVCRRKTKDVNMKFESPDF